MLCRPRLRRAIERPLEVGVTGKGIDAVTTELCVTAPMDAGGHARPRVLLGTPRHALHFATPRSGILAVGPTFNIHRYSEDRVPAGAVLVDLLRMLRREKDPESRKQVVIRKLGMAGAAAISTEAAEMLVDAQFAAILAGIEDAAPAVAAESEGVEHLSVCTTMYSV